MSVDDRQDQGNPVEIDLSDLGTIPEAALAADRADPKRRAERQAALEEIEALERSGRLLLGYDPSVRHSRRSRSRGGASSTG